MSASGAGTLRHVEKFKQQITLWMRELLRRPTLPTQQEQECADVADVGTLLCEVQFLCFICEDVFTDPVSIQCGHNFCKDCITQNWTIHHKCQCPICKEPFSTWPDLKVNTFISQMVALFKVSKAGDIPCDICGQLKALKSCLVCQVSYCENHLEPHLRVSHLKRHQLIDPVENLESKLCTKHNKPLDRFCVTDQTSVCNFCSVLDHKTHKIVQLKEYEEMKGEMGNVDAEIQKRRLKIQELKHSVTLSQENAAGGITDGLQVFTALEMSVEKEKSKFFQIMEEKERAKVTRKNIFIKDLEQEMYELMKRRSKLEQHLLSEDCGPLLKFQYLNIQHLPTDDRICPVSIGPTSYKLTLVRALVLLQETLRRKRKILSEAELHRVQQYEVDVTLDPDSAHPKLILSVDGKQVKDGIWKKLPNNPERYSKSLSVLGKQGVSSGRFYVEIQVEGKNQWTLGVARISVSRKGQNTLRPEDGYWTVWLSHGKAYEANDQYPVHLPVECSPKKIGLFVDYEEGLVSFFDVDASSLLYSFTDCHFADKLLPYFSPSLNYGGINSAPLIICPVTKTERNDDGNINS